MSKKSELLDDPDVSRWFHNLERGSPITADTSVRRLGLFCELNKTTPKGLLKLAPKSKLSKACFDLICDTVTRLEKEGKKGLYIDAIRKAVVSWLKYNEVVLTNSIKVNGAKDSQVQTKAPVSLTRSIT